MCVEWYMQAHVHVGMTHTHTLALVLLYVHASVHIKEWIRVLFSNLIIKIACIQSCFMKRSETTTYVFVEK